MDDRNKIESDYDGKVYEIEEVPCKCTHEREVSFYPYDPDRGLCQKCYGVVDMTKETIVS